MLKLSHVLRQQRQVLWVVMCETLGFKLVAFSLYDVCVFVCVLVCLCVSVCVVSEVVPRALGVQ